MEGSLPKSGSCPQFSPKLYRRVWTCVKCRSINDRHDDVCGICSWEKPDVSQKRGHGLGNISPSVEDPIPWSPPNGKLKSRPDEIVNKYPEKGVTIRNLSDGLMNEKGTTRGLRTTLGKTSQITGNLKDQQVFGKHAQGNDRENHVPANLAPRVNNLSTSIDSTNNPQDINPNNSRSSRKIITRGIRSRKTMPPKITILPRHEKLDECSGPRCNPKLKSLDISGWCILPNFLILILL